MKIRIIPVAAGLATAAGLAITGASLANADAGTATASSYSAPGPERSGPPAQGDTPPNANGNSDPSTPMRDDEQLLTGDIAARVTAAAQAEEPGATIERVETDSEGVYEAHMVREDGTRITLQIDKSYAVTNVQKGMAGGRGGRGPGQETTSPESSTTPTT